jgi:hypothetical protein
MHVSKLRLALLSTVLVACASTRAPEPLPFAEADAKREPQPSRNWSILPERAEEILRSRPFEISEIQGAGAGVTGARKVDLVFEATEQEEDEVYLWEMSGDVDLKAKPFPLRHLDGWNNNPRKEMATYEVQKLFLEPRDYVVPTTVGRCIPLGVSHRTRPGMKPTLEATNCVLMALSLWLEEVTVPDVFYDEARFRRDATYAYYYGIFNILTYLADHLDNRRGNFLVSKDDRYPRAYAIDNGIAFGSWIYNWFVPSSYAWRNIVVPALPKSAVERLREVRRSDLGRFAVLAEFRRDAEGFLAVVPPGPSLDPSRGVNLRGTVVQLGLSEDEIDDVWERIQDLIERVDAGEIAVF